MGAESRADRHAHRLQPAGGLRPVGVHRCPGSRRRAGQAARQPDPLPRDGGGGDGDRKLSWKLELGGKQFGKGESAITARLPLMVRPSPPRFLNFGDRFELPVVLQNQTDAAMQVDVAVRAAQRRAHGRRRVQGHGPGQRPRRGALPGHDGQRRHGPLPGGRRAGAETRFLSGRRRRAVRAAGLDARHDGGVRGLRGRRFRRREPAGDRPDERLHPVRRAGDHDLFDGAAGADRRRALPGLLPVRVLRAARLAHPGRGGAARRPHGVRGRGAADAGGDRGRGGSRHRAAARHAEPRRRLPDLAARAGVVAVQQHPRGQRPAAGEAQGLRGARGDAGPGRTAICGTSRTTSRRTGAPTSATR